ncbi:protein enabled homolog isoform X2 [Acipenser ruthenus]|uniref:protein enabled homolog isoform X2 n=1 Tax=Acipenser ruthenus TaxID=7906 RepID=UPI002740BDE6|nr:protein enabled homolog isoform X2 [Acipenser ruthenus]
MSISRAPARDSTETPGQRERIRSRMKMVIDQLEGILRELKEVARELREQEPWSHPGPLPLLDPCLSWTPASHLHSGTHFPILPEQHTKNPTLPHQLRNPAPGSGPGTLPPRLLQLSPGWPPCVHHPSAPAHPELRCSSGVLSASLLPRNSTALLTSLTPDHRSHRSRLLYSPTDAVIRLHPATSRPSSLPTPPLDLSTPPALEDWLYLFYAPLPPEPAPSPPSPRSGGMTFLQMSGLPSP